MQRRRDYDYSDDHYESRYDHEDDFFKLSPGWHGIAEGAALAVICAIFLVIVGVMWAKDRLNTLIRPK